MSMPAKTERNSAVIAAYENHDLREVAEIYGISWQRVQQIIKRFEADTGTRLPRHKCGPHAPRIEWQCKQCGLKRAILASDTRRLKTQACGDCYYNRRDAQTEEWVAARLAGSGWTKIAVAAGMKNNQHVHRVPLTIFLYLRRHNRLDELPEIWRGASTKWLSKRFPEVVLPRGTNET